MTLKDWLEFTYFVTFHYVWLHSLQLGQMFYSDKIQQNHGMNKVAGDLSLSWILNSNLLQLCSSIISISVIRLFGGFAQSTVVILSCPAQIFKLFGWLGNKLWENNISWVLNLRWVLDGYPTLHSSLCWYVIDAISIVQSDENEATHLFTILMTYRKVSNIRCTLVGNKIVEHSDVVGAPPVGAAPTPSSFST